MCPVKPLLLFIILFFSSFNVQVNRPYLARWVITKGCSLKVGGSTNVNKFSCVIANYSRPDTLTFYKGGTTEAVKISGYLKLDVQNFDCHNPVMTRDLRKTLKAKEYPKLVIRFLSLSRYPRHHEDNAIKGAVTIELAGVTKRFDVNYKLLHQRTNSLTLVGTRRVKFSDFDIIPPRKIGGMIKTNNELDVEFSLNVNILN